MGVCQTRQMKRRYYRSVNNLVVTEKGTYSVLFVASRCDFRLMLVDGRPRIICTLYSHLLFIILQFFRKRIGFISLYCTIVDC